MPSENAALEPSVLQVKYILDRDVGAASELAERLKVPAAAVGKPTQWDDVCQDDRWVI